MCGYVWPVLTPDLLRQVFEAIAGDYVGDLAFDVMYTHMLDYSEHSTWPRIHWRPATMGMNINVATATLAQNATCEMWVLGQVDSDRSGNEVSQMHGQMSSLASLVLGRFCELYVFDTTDFQGQALDLSFTGAPSFEPVWDAENMATGVRVTFTVQDNRNIGCTTAYFA